MAASVGESISKTENALKELGIDAKTVTHPAVFVCETHEEEFQKVAEDDLKSNTTLCKNLFLKVKNNFYLVVVRPDLNLNYGAYGKYLGIKTPRMAGEEHLQNTLSVGKGSVTPLALINNQDKNVQVVLDQKLTESKYLGVHPLTNEATTCITPGDLTTFVNHFGKELKIVDFDKELPPPKKGKGKGKGGGGGQDGKKGKKGKGGKKGKQAENLKGLTFKKEEDFGEWYSQVVSKSELIDYYDISGCYILRPDSYFIWEQIQAFFNENIRRMGVKNAYFPLFVSKSALEAEADHIEGFAPEVAWVTRSGKHELHEHIAIRPTSETIMYPAYSNWIRNHRDLPLRLNQWCNVVRWEFKNPTPFIRTREFLWQEGHSAFATKEEADKEVMDILNLYARVYEEVLSIPVIKGRKTENEKFPGGDYTTTVEAFIPTSGRGVQGATSHGLGQHFGKIFKITFQDQKKETHIPYQNSWGLTTRTIGVMVMQHSDDKGLVLPPRVASIQAVIVPIVFKKSDDVIEASKILETELQDAGIRTHVDDRDNHNPGWKFNEWELKGVPLRIEVGPRDMRNRECVLVRRDTGEKSTSKWRDLVDTVQHLLEQIQKDLLTKARVNMDNSKVIAKTWDEFTSALDHKKMAFSPSCNESKCEDNVKERTKGEKVDEEAQEAEAAAQAEAAAKEAGAPQDGKETFEKLTGAAKALCIPFDQPDLPDDAVCVGCGEKATTWVLYGRSY